MPAESDYGRGDPSARRIPDASEQLDLAVPSLETALQARPEERIDRHLGRGIGFTLKQNDHTETQLELYSEVVRVTVPTGQLVVPRREAEVCPEGVVFRDQNPERYLLSVGPNGDVLFQYHAPGTPASEPNEIRTPVVPIPEPASPVLPPSPAPEPKEKAKSERYIGRMGEVRTHRTKQGRLVAEVELTVADPDRPGASRLVKFAAFGEKAELLQRSYQPGQEVTAVGIPHELKRRTRDGKEYVEQQFYLVQLPKLRE